MDIIYFRVMAVNCLFQQCRSSPRAFETPFQNLRYILLSGGKRLFSEREFDFLNGQKLTV